MKPAKHINLLYPWIPLLVMVLLAVTHPAAGQDDKKEIRSGNTSYEKGQYSNAELEYRKALEKNATSYAGTYNLGSALYRQDKQSEAVTQYTTAVERAASPEEKAAAYHNLGNALVKAERFGEAVSAYKNALKLNPGDQDTRYNLAYAQAKLKQQQQQQNNQQDQQGDKNNEQKQKQNQQKDQQQQDQKQEGQSENNKDGEQQKEGQGKPQPRPKISKEDAERILQALKNNEQELNRKLSKKEGVRINVEKNW